MEKALKIVDAAEDFRRCVLATLQQTRSRGERATLIATYLDTAIEHHQAITMLIRAELYGSAFALARSVYDSALRAFWVNKCASEEDIAALLRTDNHKRIIPPSKELFAALDAAYKLKDEVQNLQPEWAALCSYAHSGLLQLSRRGFRGARQHGYCPKDIIQILDLTTSSLASLARVFLAASGNGIWALFVTTAESEYYRKERSSTAISTGSTHV
jgi:hypothetical protein